MVDENDDEYLVPLQDQRIFGAGLSRKKISFVLSSNPDRPVLEAPESGAGDRYLAIVLNKSKGDGEGKEKQEENVPLVEVDLGAIEHSNAICEICELPIAIDELGPEPAHLKPHETSLAHQVCLEHSHTPSHLDRNRHGLKYLSTYGWDPDARLGLGATGTGIRIPIKPKPKNDTLGLGLIAPSSPKKVTKPTAKKLDAGKTREAEVKGKKDREKLRNMFYQSDEMDKYLGWNG